MRIVLFLCTNFSVIVLFGYIINILGCCVSSNIKLMSIVSIFGLGGAFISLFLSKSIALSAVRGVIVNQASNAIELWLLQIVRDQSEKLNIVTPQLAIYNSQDMNAFTTGICKNSALIIVSSNLLENMNRESIEAVVAHEMNHIVSGDMITMTLIQGVLNTFVIFISRSLTNLIYYGISLIYDEENEKNNNNFNYYYENNIGNSFLYIVISSVLELCFGVIASIIVFWFSRHREFYADAGAARLVGRRKMIAALRELKCNYGSNMSRAHNSSISTLYISNSVCNKKAIFSLFFDLFSSHPSLDKRIRALQYGLYLKSFYFF